MMNTKKILKNLQRVASFGRKESESQSSSKELSTSCVADKGCFIVYSLDGKRFMLPLAYLDTPIFELLLNISEEEFGLPRDGPISLPCDSQFLEYILCLLQRKGFKTVEKLLLETVLKDHPSPVFTQLIRSDQQAVCGF